MLCKRQVTMSDWTMPHFGALVEAVSAHPHPKYGRGNRLPGGIAIEPARRPLAREDPQRADDPRGMNSPTRPQIVHSNSQNQEVGRGEDLDVSLPDTATEQRMEQRLSDRAVEGG